MLCVKKKKVDNKKKIEIVLEHTVLFKSLGSVQFFFLFLKYI